VSGQQVCRVRVWSLEQTFVRAAEDQQDDHDLVFAEKQVW